MDARIPDRRSPHELIQQKPIDPGQGQQQLQARLALPGLQPRQRTGRHSSLLGHLVEGAILLPSQSSQSGTYSCQRLPDGLLRPDRARSVGRNFRLSARRVSSPLAQCTAGRSLT